MKKIVDLYVKTLDNKSVVVSYAKSFKHCIEFCSMGDLAQWLIAVENLEDVTLNTIYVKDKEPRMIWSEYIESMIPYGFTKGKYHYTWCETDLLYYNDDVDDSYYMEIPQNAVIDTI